VVRIADSSGGFDPVNSQASKRSSSWAPEMRSDSSMNSAVVPGRAAHPAPRLHHRRSGCRRALARRARSRQPRGPPNHHEVRPWPAVARPARDIHRRDLHRRRITLTNNGSAFGASATPNAGPGSEPERRTVSDLA
jgi:hypothetical protein